MMGEKNVLALMGHASNLFCSHCLVRRVHSCDEHANMAPKRQVVETLEAQFFAAEIRMRDPRVSLRAQLAVAHSALPFIPVLGAMHGMSTGNASYVRIIMCGSWGFCA